MTNNSFDGCHVDNNGFYSSIHSGINHTNHLSAICSYNIIVFVFVFANQTRTNLLSKNIMIGLKYQAKKKNLNL